MKSRPNSPTRPKMTEPRRLVTNTGPLIALSGIGQLGLLDALYDDVRLPTQVHDEILLGLHAGRNIAAYRDASFLQVTPLEAPLDPMLREALDDGEAAAIQLARQEQIDHILIDDRKGRRIARNVYGLSVLGTLRILINAKQAGLLDRVDELIPAMRQNGYWLHDQLIDAALREAGER